MGFRGFRFQVPVLWGGRRALAQPPRSMHHQPVTTEGFAALGALIQLHADADSHVVEDGGRLFRVAFRDYALITDLFKGPNSA